jgi:hypothetical protein
MGALISTSAESGIERQTQTAPSTPFAAGGRTLCSMTVRGVSREAAIADYGVVLTGEPDENLVSYDAAARDAARATRPALAEVFFDRGPGYARLSGGVSYADVDAVGS